MRWVAWVVAAVVLAGCVQPEPEPATVVTKTTAVAGAPQVSFTWEPQEPRAGDDVRFVPQVKVAKGSNVTSWKWNLGDGVLASTAAVTHAFPTAGNRTVELRVTASDGQTGLAKAVVRILPAAAGTPPVAEGGGNATLPSGEAPPAAGPVLEPAVAQLRSRVLEAIATGSSVAVDSFEVDTFLGFDSVGPSSQFRLVLKPGLALHPDFWAEVDGSPAARPFVEVYEGHVEGQPDKLARLTIASGWARGAVRVGDQEHLIRVNMDENLPRSRSALAATPAAAPPPPPPARVDPAWWTDDEQCTGGLSGWAPLTVTPVAGLGRSTLPAIQAEVILDADAGMLERFGEDTMPLMVAMLNEMDMTYDYEVGVRFQVVGVHANTDSGYYPDPDQTSPLQRLEDYWAQRHREERDLVHLFTGHASGYAEANCIGGAGSPAGVSFTPISWEEQYTVFHTRAFAHEFGHLFAAHHHYGNHVESELATIMIQGYTPGAQPVFGTLERSVIRGWAQQMLR
jgi:plastocyanin